jgi:hypothetical protein
MGSVYGTYRYAKTFIETAESGLFSYTAILEENERKQTELEYKELKLEIKPTYTTKKLCEQLYEIEQQLIEQADYMDIENVFDRIEGSIGAQTAIHASLFSREHPAREIILSYLFKNSIHAALLPELRAHENQSDEEENQRRSPTQ